ncbi:MAG: hypothetical protein KME45_30985 [Stenomitos rutilans HA7619-LM2]|jgi:hypothetical protein|nr:hypothetical protein [Stenomitos rutilans HA7619-LM2]
MLTLEELKSILNRIRTGSETEADAADLRRSLKLEGEIVQIGLQQGQYNVNIGKVEGQDIQFGDHTSALSLHPSLRYSGSQLHGRHPRWQTLSAYGFVAL